MGKKRKKELMRQTLCGRSQGNLRRLSYTRATSADKRANAEYSSPVVPIATVHTSKYLRVR